jgi:hypothetical protein
MKIAIFSPRLKVLSYWNTRNTTVTLYCPTIDRARAIINYGKVEQLIQIH